ncbi:MAG: hypothetical protein GC160_02970 [Acidobacteria bacterium]|nr:hypothetical protein [Acidobacteriota bacterium]
MTTLRNALPALLLLTAAAAWAGKVLDHTFPAMATTGACSDTLAECIASGEVLDLGKLDVVTLGVQINPTGDPTGCALALEGSLDGESWMVMGSTSDCTADALCAGGSACRMVGSEARLVRYVRPNPTTLSGGTTPSLTVILRGVTR